MHLIGACIQGIRRRLTTRKTQTNQKWARDVNRRFSEEETWMGNQRVKRCPTSPVIRELQTETKTSHRSPTPP